MKRTNYKDELLQYFKSVSVCKNFYLCKDDKRYYFIDKKDIKHTLSNLHLQFCINFDLNH